MIDLEPGKTLVEGPYVDFVPGYGLSGGILYNNDSFSAGRAAYSAGAMIGAGYQFCEITVRSCTGG